MAYASSGMNEMAAQQMAQSYAPQQQRATFNALEHTGYVLESSRALAERVQRLVAKFVGPANEGSEQDTAHGGPGIFHQLHRASEETGISIRKANEALDRLEKELA